MMHNLKLSASPKAKWLRYSSNFAAAGILALTFGSALGYLTAYILAWFEI